MFAVPQAAKGKRAAPALGLAGWLKFVRSTYRGWASSPLRGCSWQTRVGMLPRGVGEHTGNARLLHSQCTESRLAPAPAHPHRVGAVTSALSQGAVRDAPFFSECIVETLVPAKPARKGAHLPLFHRPWIEANSDCKDAAAVAKSCRRSLNSIQMSSISAESAGAQGGLPRSSK